MKLDPSEEKRLTSRHENLVNVFTNGALILLFEGGSPPQGVDTVHRHSQTKAGVGLSALQPELLHHGPHHIAAALHASNALQQIGHQHSFTTEREGQKLNSNMVEGNNSKKDPGD